MNNRSMLYDFLREIGEEKSAGFNEAAAAARGIGGKALKVVNPVSTAVNTVSSAKNSEKQIAAKQNFADSMMGVSGRFNKVAADKDDAEDKRYGRLYRKKEKEPYQKPEGSNCQWHNFSWTCRLWVDQA